MAMIYAKNATILALNALIMENLVAVSALKMVHIIECLNYQIKRIALVLLIILK